MSRDRHIRHAAKHQTAPQVRQAGDRPGIDFAASTAYRRVNAMSKHVLMIIYMIEFISERYKASE